MSLKLPIALALLLLAAPRLLLPGAPAPRRQAMHPRPSSAAVFPPPGWNPVRGAPRGLHYVGARVCVACHAAQATELHTPMGQAAWPAAASPILRRHPTLSWLHQSWRYRISPASSVAASGAVSGAASAWLVRARPAAPAAASRALAVRLLWGFGDNRIGQTFIFRAGRHFYESRVSYFHHLHRLSLTIGDAAAPSAASPLRALGRPLFTLAAARCFGCHTTGALRASGFHPALARPGVRCEECHGPGSAHVAALRAHRYRHPEIFNPARLSPSGQVRFCGSCHRTLSMVLARNLAGRIDVRFQPYRLVLSQCWEARPNDARLSCLTCHDPHQPLATRARSYDHACLACHSPAVRQPRGRAVARLCPVAQHACVRCHMPRVQVRAAHYRFVDHDIRIVKKGAPYPE